MLPRIEIVPGTKQNNIGLRLVQQVQLNYTLNANNRPPIHEWHQQIRRAKDSSIVISLIVYNYSSDSSRQSDRHHKADSLSR